MAWMPTGGASTPSTEPRNINRHIEFYPIAIRDVISASLAQDQRVFCGGAARPPTQDMIAFINDHSDKHRVEPICDVLPITPATYYDHLAKRVDPARLSDRAKWDEKLRPHIQRVFGDNWRVYGVRKVWWQLRREGFDIARCTVVRLMKAWIFKVLSVASRTERLSPTGSYHWT